MKQILKRTAKRLTAILNRLGEDFNMLLLEDVLPYPADSLDYESFDEELFV